MNPSFNLIDRPWIPCLTSSKENKIVELSLQEIFKQAHEIDDIAADSPMECVALYRFLLAILHRSINGPATVEAWATLWNVETLALPEIESYLSDQYDRFDLFSNDYPFCQGLDERVKPKSVISLKHGFGMLPSDWFDHQIVTLDVELTPAEAVRALLSVLSFGFGGLSGIPRKSHKDAPCAKGVNFIVEGSNLKQTLLLNLDEYIPPKFRTNPDRPFWELEAPFISERTGSRGMIDYLVFPSRQIKLYLNPEKLESGEMIVDQYQIGLGHRLGDEERNPLKHYYESKASGLLELSFDEDKQLWRNSSSFLELSPEKGKPPAIFTWLHTLTENKVLDKEFVITCKALGIAKNQGRADFHRIERIPLPLSILGSQEKLNVLKNAINHAERTSWVIDRNLAISSMYLHLNEPEKFTWGKKQIKHADADKDLNKLKSTEAVVLDWIKYTGVERHYWSSLDIPFIEFMERLGQATEEELQTVLNWWKGQVRTAAEDAFRQVLNYTNRSPRSFKAYAKGSNPLNGYLNKHFPIANQENSTL